MLQWYRLHHRPVWESWLNQTSFVGVEWVRQHTVAGKQGAIRYIDGIDVVHFYYIDGNWTQLRTGTLDWITEIADFLTSMPGAKVLYHTRGERGLPPHLWLQEHNTAIVPHRVIKTPQTDRSPGDYVRIADQAEMHNLRVVQIWEDLWRTKRPVIESRLASITGNTARIYARNTHVTAWSQKDMDLFLHRHHLLGAASGRYRYCLILGDVPVAAALFSKPRNIHRNGMNFRSCEMIRYCSTLGTTVTGGLGKLLQHFIRQHAPEDIMTYADRDWSTGSAYTKLGFVATEKTAPVTFWIEPGTLERIFPGKQHTYIQEQGWEVPVGASEEALFKAKGYAKAYNAGNLKYVKLLKDQ